MSKKESKLSKKSKLSKNEPTPVYNYNIKEEPGNDHANSDEEDYDVNEIEQLLIKI